MKIQVDEFINSNYTKLVSTAKKYGANCEDATEIVSMLYEHLIYNPHKWQPDKALQFSNKFIYNQINLKNSDFNRLKMDGFKNSSNCHTPHVSIQEAPEINYEQNYDLICENINKHTIDWLNDNIIIYGKEKAEMLAKIEIAKSNLDIYERILFNKYFDNQLSMRDISEQTRLPLSTIHQLIKNLIEKIKRNAN
jgi:RNA polymerase sigma factor (sigma-70 family)